MGWPRSQECLALLSPGDELWMWRVLLTCRAEQKPLLQQARPACGLVLRARGPDVLPRSGVIRPSEMASASSLDLADGSFHFCGGECNEAAAE